MLLRCTEPGLRLDYFLSQVLPELSRSRIKKIIKDGLVSINGLPAKASKQLNPGDEISFPDETDSETVEILPADIKIEKIYEDDDLLIINKFSGQVVHPGIGHQNDTIVNGLMKLYGDSLPDIGGRQRPGIVHRLDKDTSGLLMVALTDRCFQNLVEMQKEHRIKKIYLGICFGIVKDESGEIRYPIGRSTSDRKLFTKGGINPRSAITLFRVIDRNDRFTLLSFGLVTGRTHQIRVHMKALNHPIVGDIQYSSAGRKIKACSGEVIELDHHLLTAVGLEMEHPVTGNDLSVHLPYEKCPSFSNFFPKPQSIHSPY